MMRRVKWPDQIEVRILKVLVQANDQHFQRHQKHLNIQKVNKNDYEYFFIIYI